MEKVYKVDVELLKQVKSHLKKNKIVNKEKLKSVLFRLIFTIPIGLITILYIHNRYIKEGYSIESVNNNTKMLLFMLIPIVILMIYFYNKLDLISIMKPYKNGDIISVVESSNCFHYKIIRNDKEILCLNNDSYKVLSDEVFDEIRLILYLGKWNRMRVLIIPKK